MSFIVLCCTKAKSSHSMKTATHGLPRIDRDLTVHSSAPDSTARDGHRKLHSHLSFSVSFVYRLCIIWPTHTSLSIVRRSITLQWRIQDVSEGQAQSQDWNVNTTSDVIAKRSLEGEALAFLGGSGGMLPRKILKIEMLRYAFSALLGVFLSLNKGSKLLSWIVIKLKTPTVRYGRVGLFYVCENPPAFYEHHTGWAWLSPRKPLRAYLFFEVFPIYGARNVNDVEEFQRRWNPFSFYPIWKLSLHSTRARPGWFENARRLIDGLVEK